jgi:glutathione synthase/RimK-type ligase-like ATP-grasp enzyme
MILILSSIDESNVNEVIDILNARHCDTVRINSEEVTDKHLLTYGYHAGEFSIAYGREKIIPDNIGAIWTRKWGDFFLPDDPCDKFSKNLITHESRYAFNAALYQLKDKNWMNPPFETYRTNRVVQAQVAQSVGLCIPDFIITQDLDEAMRFFEQNNGRVICKHISQGGSRQGGEKMIFTNIVQASELAGNQQLVNCPTMFQSYIEKQIELRITIIGNKIFSAAIDSQSANNAMIDWRQANNDTVPHYGYQLPQEIEHKLLALMQALGLVFGAIDMILDKNGNYVFVEVNPEGQWGWIEYFTGQGIYDEVANWLQANDKP